METKIQNKNRIKTICRNTFFITVLFFAICVIGLGVFANQFSYSENDVNSVTAVLEDVTYKDECCDLVFGENSYRINAKLLDSLDTEKIESLIGEEITIHHLDNDPYYFVVGIESSQINLSIQDGLDSVKNLPALICFAALSAILLGVGIFLLVKFVKAPAYVECDATLYALIKKVEPTPHGKKLSVIGISYISIFFLIFLATIIVGETSENDVAFYVLLGLSGFLLLMLVLCSPFLARWNRKKSIPYIADYFANLEKNAEENNIFYSFPGSYCKFEAEKITIYSDNDDLFENISANKYQKAVACKQINFVANALFKTNGTVSIAITGQTKQGDILNIDLDADLMKIIKDFKIEVAGLEFLLSNLPLLLEKYKGKLYFVSFDKQGVTEARKISFKEHIKYL